MKESEFHRLADAQFQAIEEAIEECGVDIDFDTSGGVVTLTGTADSQANSDKASAIAMAVDGVENVVNQLTLTATQ